MIRYQYNPRFSPPAPLVNVTLRNPETGKERADFPAQLDTAADRTVVPRRIVDDLGLVQMDELAISGVGGHISLMPTFGVLFRVHQFSFARLEILAHQEEPFVLLGRDVLNQFRILLDGPNQAFEIE
jgi:predicted aspartyl protease